MADLSEGVTSPLLEKAQDAIDAISPNATKKEVLKSGALPKLKRLYRKGVGCRVNPRQSTDDSGEGLTITSRLLQ